MTFKINPQLLAAGLMAATVLGPTLSPAQSVNHRRKTENTWRGATYGSAALGALGLLTHNGTMTAIGAAGTLYSGSRWQHDMRSREHLQHQRAETYSHRHFYSGKHHFIRKTTYRNGKKYYYFKREY